MFQIKFVQKIKTYILRSVTFFSPENRAIYEIMSKNVMEPERPQMTTWRRVACWISEATRAQVHTCACILTPTHARACTRPRARTCAQKYSILIAFPRQQWLRERGSMLRYTYIACLV
jgi:hypothetical protein